jgi:hypothetical protein
MEWITNMVSTSHHWRKVNSSQPSLTGKDGIYDLFVLTDRDMDLMTVTKHFMNAVRLEQRTNSEAIR